MATQDVKYRNVGASSPSAGAFTGRTDNTCAQQVAVMVRAPFPRTLSLGNNSAARVGHRDKQGVCVHSGEDSE